MDKFVDDLESWLEDHLPDLYEGKEHAEADGTSEYDYYEGLIEAYEIVLMKIKEYRGR